jgi:tetratricopeptide (TPR) repeat protein
MSRPVLPRLPSVSGMRGFLATVMAAGMLASTAAHAASPADEASARDAMKRGIAAFARGDAATALELYQEAEKAVPEANGPYRYAAEALFKLNRYAEAIESLEKYLALRPNVSDAGEVHARIAEIRAEHLPGKAEVSSTPPGALLFVDDATSSAGAAPRELTLDPGPHSIRGESPGYADAVVKMRIVGSVTTDVALTLTPVSRPSQGLSLTTWGWMTAATGAALLVGALVVDTTLLGPAISDFRAAAQTGASNAESLQSKASTFRAVAIGGYALGAAGAVAGTTMIVLGNRGSPARSVAWGVWGAAGSGGVAVRAPW